MGTTLTDFLVNTNTKMILQQLLLPHTMSKFAALSTLKTATSSLAMVGAKERIDSVVNMYLKKAAQYNALPWECMQNVLENSELSLKVFNPSCKNDRTISIPCWAIGVAFVYAATDGAIKEAQRSVAAMSKLSEADAVKLLATSYGGLKATNGAIDYCERASSLISTMKKMFEHYCPPAD